MVIRTMHRLLRCHKRVVFYNIFPDVCVCVICSFTHLVNSLSVLNPLFGIQGSDYRQK